MNLKGTLLALLCSIAFAATPPSATAQSFSNPLSPLAAGLPSPTRAKVLRPGSKVPDFVLANLEGNPRRFSSFAGRPVILNFWATWCAPCRAEMPLLQSFYEEHQDEGLVLLGIDAGESLDQVKGFLDETEVTYPVWLDPPGTEPQGAATHELFQTFGGIGLPTTLFIDESGVLRKVHVGEIDRETLEEEYVNLRAVRAEG